MHLIGVDATYLPWLHYKVGKRKDVVCQVSERPAVQLHTLGIVIADFHILIRFLIAGAIVENCGDDDIPGWPRGRGWRC